ncbi:helix-turn-helix transcriptional regulator, partial [Micrococcus luteus]|nr:helix-turn-helix transcriptional regulator [Micrococcus luteus]
LSLSRTHLTRMFVQHAGAAPMRLLTELRLTEFARLIEETDISVMRAASEVGWSDPRVASHWFHRRYGITPTQYRRTPHTVPDHRQGKAVAVNDSAL